MPSIPSRIKKTLLHSVEKIVGPGAYSERMVDRINYSRDSSFRGAIQNKYNKIEFLPDLITWPKSVDEVQKLVRFANRHKLPIIPYGAGSGVCGGTNAVFGGMIVDLKKIRKILKIDPDSLSVTVECGMMGLHLENELERGGFTLGHFPSSILCASLGGYLAARSAGQNSSRFGKIEDMVKTLEVVTGDGQIIQTRDVTNSEGIDLNQIFLGSEGTLGLITQATLKIFPRSSHQAFQAFSFAHLSSGIESIRRIMQSGLKPSVVRLYDPLDSLILQSKKKGNKSSSLKGSSHKALSLPDFLLMPVDLIKNQSMKMALQWPKTIDLLCRLITSQSLLIFMHEGLEKIVSEERLIAREICQQLGGIDLGEGPARNWYEHRYSVSYMASPLFYSGLFTDTIEVATTWDKINVLYEEIKKGMSPHALVMAHISHAYSEGASIYFTFLAPLSGLKASEELFDTIWDKAMKACQRVGGVISHHHGIGRLKAKYMGDEWGEGIELFRIFKNYFDPSGIMNPGKLIPLKKTGRLEEKAA